MRTDYKEIEIQIGVKRFKGIMSFEIKTNNDDTM